MRTCSAQLLRPFSRTYIQQLWDSFRHSVRRGPRNRPLHTSGFGPRGFEGLLSVPGSLNGVCTFFLHPFPMIEPNVCVTGCQPEASIRVSQDSITGRRSMKDLGRIREVLYDQHRLFFRGRSVDLLVTHLPHNYLQSHCKHGGIRVQAGILHGPVTSLIHEVPGGCNLYRSSHKGVPDVNHRRSEISFENLLLQRYYICWITCMWRT